jgi:hypothetical protein
MLEIPPWSDPFPDATQLRDEVNGMVESVRDALLGALPNDQIAGLYFKGSAQKTWNTPLDYVPELSDADIHIWFTETAEESTHRIGIPLGQRIQADIERRFFEKHRHSLHVPRPHFVVLNDLMKQKNYVSSPTTAVDKLYGLPYPESDFSDIHRLRMIDYENMMCEVGYLDRLPMKIIDRPGHYLWEALASIAWHISPVGPRVLTLAGTDPQTAWSMNRTQIVRALETVGEAEFADVYATYYFAAWQFFFSGRSYSVAAQEAVIAGVNVLKRGIEFAKVWRENEVRG